MLSRYLSIDRVCSPTYVLSEFLGNSITNVAPTAFNGSSAISVIDLSNNVISSWDPATLAGLGSLTTISLANNSLTAIPANMFSGAPNLVVM